MNRNDPHARWALIAFVVVSVCALPLLLALGRHRWFFHDEWDFLAARDGGDIGDLFIPHNEHWSTLPILAYRALFRLVGLRSYLPYQALLVVLHLAAAALLRGIMRRAEVAPWIATAAASLFVLFGAGYQNLVWAFQIGFVASLVFGLTHLLLADHDGSVDRRDGLGLLAGVAGLLCSGVAIAMVVVVGVASFVRRGWRVALLHTAPLAALVAVWFSIIRHKTTEHRIGYGEGDLAGFGDVVRFVGTGVGATFHAMGQLPWVGVVLGVVLGVGLLAAWFTGERSRRFAAPLALLLGGLVFLVLTGLGRGTEHGPEFARRSRYLHLVAAMALPAIAVAADAVVRRWRVLGPAVLVLLLIGIPGNIDALVDGGRREKPVQQRYKLLMLSFPRVRYGRGLSPDVRPELKYANPVTLGWLRGQAMTGRLPDPGPVPAAVRAEATRLLGEAAYRLALAPDFFDCEGCPAGDRVEE